MDLVHTVYEPPGDGPHPTLLVLHGWGANAFDLLGLAPHLCAGRFLVLCPQGPVQTPIGPGAVGYGWYPLVPGTAPEPHELSTAREHIERFLGAAMSRYPDRPQETGRRRFQPRRCHGLHAGFRGPGTFFPLWPHSAPGARLTPSKILPTPTPCAIWQPSSSTDPETNW